jgi:zinc/manganese transport system permease protein
VIFGLEIIKRGVIFTDLAIGQIAAVGMAISVGFLDSEYQLLLTLSFALLGALLITYATRKVEHLEAFIGMLYALGASSIMLLLATSPHGAELFQKLSATDILFTTPDEIYPSAILYVLVAGVMFLLYPKTTGLIRELTFFSMLALIVTSSVQLAGVLVVFVLLVAPAFIALSQKRFTPLYLAWASGLLLSLVSLVVSYYFDLPTGYSIIFFQSIAVVIFSLFVHKRS